jgi:hypothetical protein
VKVTANNVTDSVSGTSSSIITANPTPALDTDPNFIMLLKFKANDINESTGVITNYGMTTS